MLPTVESNERKEFGLADNSASALGSAINNVKEFPFAVFGIVSISFSVLYNVGFYSRVGLEFMDAYSLQEHITFAMSGLFFVIAFFTIALGLTFVVRSDRPGQKRRWYVNFGLAYILGLTAAVLFSLYQKHPDLTSYVFENSNYLATLAIAVAMYISFALVIWRWSSGGGRRSLPYLAIAISIFIPYVTGTLVAEYRLSTGFATRTLAKTKVGDLFKVLRFGSEFTILAAMDGKERRLVRTDTIQLLQNLPASESETVSATP